MTRVLGPHASRLQAVVPWLVAAVAVAAYMNALQNGFAFDDEGIILRNDVVHHIDAVWRAFALPYWPNGAGQYRPLVIASFTTEWALWGASPAGYHALNIAWHAVAAVLVYLVARRWLSFGGATIAAVIFAVQPVHVEAVSNVVGRAELMATCGVLAMVLLHTRRSPWAIAAFALALGSKEHALVAPFLVGALELLERPRARLPREHDARGGARSVVLRLYAGYAIVAAAWTVAVLIVFHSRPFAAVDPFWLSMDTRTRWLTMLGVVPVWSRLWFWPLNLSSDYSPDVTLAWPRNVLLAGAGALILLMVALMLRPRRRTHPAFTAVFWMVVTVLPVANLLIPTGVIVAERTLYLSSVGAVILLGFVAESLALRYTVLTLTLVAAIVSVFAERTWTRTPMWKSNRDVFLTTVAEHPEASWTHVILGRVYDGNGGYDDALKEYRTALKLFDKNPVTYADAIDVAVRAGEFPLADSLVGQADAHFRGNYLTTLAHSYAALEQHRYAEALRVAQAAARLAPDSARARYFAALAWVALGAPDSARAALAHVPAGHPLRKSADSLAASLPPRE